MSAAQKLAKENAKSRLAWCCAPGCDKPAEWHVHGALGPEDYAHACTEHVGDLLSSDHNTVTALDIS